MAFGKEKIMNKLRLIKFAVVIMTFLIILGGLLMLTMLYRKISKQGAEAIPQEISLGEPAESRINNMLGHDGYIYIMVKDGGKPDRIIVFNPKKGEKVSTIQLY